MLSVQALLWHHRLGHPSLPRLRGMHSCLLVSGLPRYLPPLPPLPAPPCLPCVEGRQRATPHSSSFPPKIAPLQTLHMDVWGPARVSGHGCERYFLLVVNDYTRYTTVFPLRSKGQRHIGLVMEVARTSMIHAAAPHFLWPFVVRHAAHQLNLWPRVSLPETLPTLRWTGKVGNASVFRVRGFRAFVRDTSTDKLSARAIPCVFLGFSLDAPGWQFYHPTSRCVFPSQDVTFDEPVPFYHLFPYRSAPPPPPPLFLASGPPPVDPLPPQGAAQGAASWGAEHGGAESEGAGSGGANQGVRSLGVLSLRVWSLGVLSLRVWSLGVLSLRVRSLGVLSRGVLLLLEVLRVLRHDCLLGRSLSPRLRSGAAGARGAGVSTRAGGAGGAAAARPGGARTRGTGAAETGGFGRAGAGDPTEPGAAGVGGAGADGAGAGGTGAGGARAGGLGGVDPGARGPGGTVRPRPYFVPLLQMVLGVTSSTGLTPPLLFPPPDQSQPPIQPASPLPAPPYAEQSGSLTKRREPASRPASRVRTGRRVPCPRPPPIPGTHAMALRPSSVPLRVPLPPPPDSSLPAYPDPESDRARAATPTVSRFLATLVTDPSFESTASSALVAELLDFWDAPESSVKDRDASAGHAPGLARLAKTASRVSSSWCTSTTSAATTAPPPPPPPPPSPFPPFLPPLPCFCQPAAGTAAVSPEIDTAAVA
ncbi:unnamed protein product [Closterium sp. NIES-53]